MQIKLQHNNSIMKAPHEQIIDIFKVIRRERKKLCLGSKDGLSIRHIAN